MDSLRKLVEHIVLTDYDIGSTHWVDVTHVNHPHSFYIRSIECRRYMSILQARREKLEASEALVGANVVYKSPLLKMYVRGQIRVVQNEETVTCGLFALDNGCLENSIPLKKIYKPYHNVDVPSLIMHCQLAYCSPKGAMWDPEAIEAMKTFIGHDKATITIKEKSSTSMIVELMGQASPPDVSMILALTEFTLLGHPNNAINRLSAPNPSKNYYTFKNLNVDDILHVRVQSGKSLRGFYVAQIDDFYEFVRDRNDLTQDCSVMRKLDENSIKEGNVICVKTDTLYKYERALVKKIKKPRTKVIVQLMDWGTIIETHFNNIKHIAQRYLEKPAVAIYCAADESQVWDNGLHRFLYPGYEFLITIKKVGDKFNTPNIVSISPLSGSKHKKNNSLSSNVDDKST